MSLPFDDASAALYTVGQVAEMLGVQPAFVRRLDTEDMVRPARSDGGQRRYSQVEIHRIQEIAGFADQGMTLNSIREILGLQAEVESLKQQLEDQQAPEPP